MGGLSTGLASGLEAGPFGWRMPCEKTDKGRENWPCFKGVYIHIYIYIYISNLGLTVGSDPESHEGR